MQELIEKYNDIFRKISSLNAEIQECEGEIKALSDRRDNEIPARIQNLKDQTEKIEEYLMKIEGFMQLAEKHMTSKNVPTIEAPEGYRVNLSRLKSWSMLIDPMAEDDVYAKRVYYTGICDKTFLEKKKVEFAERITQLEDDLAVGAPEQLSELNEKIANIRNQIKDYLSSDEITSFSQKVRSENEKVMYETAPERYLPVEKEPEFWIPGAYGTPLISDEESAKILKESLGRFYDDKTGNVYLPYEVIPTDEEFAMTVSSIPARKVVNVMDAGIRNLILQMIQKSPVGNRKIYIIDAMRQNSALIGGLRGLEGSSVLHPIARNPEQIQATLEEIVASFSDIDDALENFDTVLEYNEKAEETKKIQRKVVIVVGWLSSFEGDSSNLVKKIFANYERYGVSFIVVRVSAENSQKGFGLSEYIGENLINVKMTMKETTIAVGQEQPKPFVWYGFKQTLSDDYCAGIKSLVTERLGLGNEYPKRVDLVNLPPYVRGNKKLSLPYGIDSKDEIQNVGFEDEGFASFLMGASGSGKSTLLHTLITGIIRNYHPDDVELWLADFKMSEFAQYMNPLPPHVKYILLDESKELVYDLIDKLTEKMMERQRFFMQHRDLKKVENIPADLRKYMPVIFVILDEFSIMSQSVSESEMYKLKLQNILAKGRALGIKFIFSSQTFRKGISGLTNTAKDQIQTRIAMKNSPDEINETLELTSNTRTEQVKNWMEALPPHFVLVKYREGDHMVIKRLKVMYFPGEGEEALIPQRNMINALNNKMRTVSEAEYALDINTYVDKMPVIKDGNSYIKYSQDKISALRQLWNKEEGMPGLKDMYFATGDPRRMTEAQFITVSNESRQNMLLLAHSGETACAMSVLKSIILQALDQGAKVHILSYARNKLYHRYKDTMFGGCSVHEGIREVGELLDDVGKKIAQREEVNDFYILLGMEQMYPDFDSVNDNPNKTMAAGVESKAQTVAQTAVRADDLPDILPDELETKADSLVANSQEQIDEINRMNEEWADLDAAIDKMFDEWLEAGRSMDEIRAEMERMQQEAVASRINSIKTENDASEAVSEATEPATEDAGDETTEATAEVVSEEVPVQVADTSDEEKPEQITETVSERKAKINPKTDFASLISNGSRYGHHVVMVLNNLTDLKMTGAKIDSFAHRLAFQLTTDDSNLLFGSTRMGSKLPEHVCQYSNSMESFSFRPFLHYGIEWDGWGVDENGNVIDPASYMD